MPFGSRNYNLWKNITNAIINSSSYEYLVFKHNLGDLSARNINETGYDPRIEGPPEHIAN